MRRLSLLIAGLIASGGLFVLLEPDPAGTTYRGRLRSDAAFQRAAGNLLSQVPTQQARVEARLGTQAAPGAAISLRFVDAAPGSSLLAWTTRAGRMRSDVVVHYPAFTLALGTAGDPARLRHELAHAILQTHIAPRAYRAIPAWAREGIAVWAAEQDRLEVEARAVVLRRARIEVVSDIDHGRLDPERYYEAGARFFWLEAHAGIAGVQGWVSDLIAGQAADEAFAARAGLTWEASRQQARNATLTAAQERLSQPDFTALRALIGSRESADFARFVSQHPASSLVPEAIRHAQRLDCLHGAQTACLEHSRFIHDNRTLYTPQEYIGAVGWEVRGLVDSGQGERAIAQLWSLEHTAGPHLDFLTRASLSVEISALHQRRGEPVHARRILERLLAEDPTPVEARRYWFARIHCLLVFLAVENGQPEEAARHLEQLDEYADLLHTAAGGALQEGETQRLQQVRAQLAR